MRIFLLVFGLFLGLIGCRGRQYSRRVHRHEAIHVNSARLYQDQVTQAMVQAVGNDDEGRRLLAFYRERGRYVVLAGSDRYHVVGSGDQSFVTIPRTGEVLDRFFIETSEPVARLRFGVTLEASFEYDDQRSTLYLPPLERFTKFWFGVFAAHEVLHAFDHLQMIERATTNSVHDHEYYLGEVRAHTFELRLLDQTTQGQVTRVFGQFLDQHLPPGALDNPNAYIGPTPDVMPIIRSVDRLFLSPQSEAERDNRLTSYLVAMNFLLAERQRDIPSVMERRARVYRLLRENYGGGW